MKNPNSRQSINEFLALKTLAVVGVARGGKEFSNRIYDALKSSGYGVVPVNPHASQIGNDRCYPDVESLPQTVDGAVIMVRPMLTEAIVRAAHNAGITRVWIHQGAASTSAVRYCVAHGMTVVNGECLLMYLAPVKGGHSLHRMVRSFFGRMPR